MPRSFITVCSPVFGVNKEYVHTLSPFLLPNLAGDLKNHTHAAGAVVGAVNRLFPVGRVGVLVCPRTAVPMGKEQYALFGRRVVARKNIKRVKRGAVECLQGGTLFRHLCPVPAKLAHKPFATPAMSLRVGHPRPESHLAPHITICAVGIKTHLGHSLFSGHRHSRSFFAAASGKRQCGCQY